HGTLTFTELTRACTDTFEIVARFLALLELYRNAHVSFDQPEPLGELRITWTGSSEGDVSVADDYGQTKDHDEGRAP
ncbi:MAG UNVERIFIED_CONTAM: segregation/condensation protein A, partial [Thermobifida fusca]